MRRMSSNGPSPAAPGSERWPLRFGVFMAPFHHAARTKSIRLGTGVVSLPYHHPLHVADRMVLLDHLTRGRVMLGVGPGQLASDAHMLGIDTNRQRAMMEEALDAIVA